jgi:S1-C subfamily serine protease
MKRSEPAEKAALEPVPVDATGTPGTAHTPVEARGTSTMRDPASPANSSAVIAEEVRIGMSFTGNPTAKHNGIEIAGVQPNGPADKIDIKPGDVIISIDGHYLYTVDELRAELVRHEDGARLAIRYRRDRLTYDNYISLTPNGAIPGNRQ